MKFVYSFVAITTFLLGYLYLCNSPCSRWEPKGKGVVVGKEKDRDPRGHLTEQTEHATQQTAHSPHSSAGRVLCSQSSCREFP